MCFGYTLELNYLNGFVRTTLLFFGLTIWKVYKKKVRQAERREENLNFFQANATQSIIDMNIFRDCILLIQEVTFCEGWYYGTKMITFYF